MRERLGGDPGVPLLLLPLIVPNDTDTSDSLLLSAAPSSYFMRKASMNPPMSEIKRGRLRRAAQGHFRQS